MLEKQIEAYLVKRCKEEKILCEKFTSPQRRSVPDRLLSYNGRCFFLELKATGKKPTTAQLRDHGMRKQHGIEVFWADSKEQIDSLLNYIKLKI